MAKVTCIDISSWQGGNIDFTKVKNAGIEAVIIRAGYGNTATQKDKWFDNNYKKAKAAGLKVGAYWYSCAGWGGVDPIADAKKEAAACLTVLKGKTFDLPVYIDMEESSKPNMPSFGKSTCTKIAQTFCDAIIKGGYRAGVYSNLNWFTNYLDYKALKAKYSIWFAQWASKNALDCDIWQNSDKGKINGISGNVDTNIIMNRAVIGGTAKPTTQTKTITQEEAITELAKEVIAGKWGNGEERKDRLYNAIQNKVNKLMGG